MAEFNYDASSKRSNRYPKIRKLGACSPAGDSMTPFVWNGKLMRMERFRGEDRNKHGVIIRDCETGEHICQLADNTTFQAAYVEGDTAYVYGVDKEHRGTIRIFSSKDLINWDERILHSHEGYRHYNTYLTKGPDGYVLLMESDMPKEIVGDHPFTYVFATSPDMVHWTDMDPSTAYPLDRYSGGPWMRYSEGWYYIIGCVELPCLRYTNYIYRTKDFKDWYVGNYNPLLLPSEEDHIVSPNAHDLGEQELEWVKHGFVISTTDIDMCDYNGKVYINYGCGDQGSFYYMAEAEADGTVAEFLKSYFE